MVSQMKRMKAIPPRSDGYFVEIKLVIIYKLMKQYCMIVLFFILFIFNKRIFFSYFYLTITGYTQAILRGKRLIVGGRFFLHIFVYGTSVHQFYPKERKEQVEESTMRGCWVHRTFILFLLAKKLGLLLDEMGQACCTSQNKIKYYS